MRVSRLLVVPSVVAAVTVAFAGPALAHVEVEASPAQALAVNATIDFNAESESTKAGIIGSRVQLPAGLSADTVTLAKAPKGWKMTSSGQVLDIRGPALAVGDDLKMTLRVRQLPQATQLVLKTVQTYSDGQKDSWIEESKPGGGEPDFPAPTVKLKAAAPGATVVPTAPATTAPAATSAAAAPSAATPTTAASSAAAAPATDDASSSSGTAVVWIGIALVLGLATAGVIVWRRRASA